MTTECADLEARAPQLEAWGEPLMPNLAGLGMEAVLCELDEARGAYDKQTPREGCESDASS